MKVKELIAKLKEFDKEAEVELLAEYDCGFGIAGGSGNTVDVYVKDNKVRIFVYETDSLILR